MIGTPHTHHYENARDALLADKHVLCEKATTSNAAELRELLKLAKERNRFFMEAMWTRFQPLTKEVKRIAEEGSLGDPVVLHADLSGDFDIHSEESSRCDGLSNANIIWIEFRHTQDPSHLRPNPRRRGSSRSVGIVLL